MEMIAFSYAELGFPETLDVETRIARRQSLSDEFVKSICASNATDRYEYAIETICTNQELWTVWIDDRGLMVWGSENMGFTTNIFPNIEFAKVFLRHSRPTPEFIPVPIDDFIDELGPRLLQQSCNVALFDVPNSNSSIVLSVNDFVLDLVGAWEHVYDIELQRTPEIERKFLESAMELYARRAKLSSRS